MNKKQQSVLPITHAIDLLLLCVYEVVIAVSTVAFHLKFYQSTVLFFFIPALYLVVRKTQKLTHIFIASIGGLGLGFVFDLFATFNHAWYIPSSQLSISVRLLGVVPVDDLVWFVGWVFFITTFYEHFLDTTKRQEISHHFRYALIVAVGLPIVTICTYVTFPSLLAVKFAYLVLALCILPFFILIVCHKPTLIPNLLKQAAFFIPVFLLHEICALMAHQWIFPGFYIGHVVFLGYTLPFEEFFFWILLSSSIVISYYEFFLLE